MSELWLSTRALADLAGISRQMAHRVAARSASGELGEWRGATLRVRVIRGAKAAGGKAFEVDASSLPLPLQIAFEEDFGPVQMPLPLPAPVMRGDATDEAEWWAHLLLPVIEHPKGSSERAAQIAKLVGTAPIDWRGVPRLLTRNTLYAKVAKFDTPYGGAVGALMRKPRSDFGRQRVTLARNLDKRLDDPATLAELRDALRLRVRGLLQKGAQWALINVTETEWLASQIEARGYRPNDKQEFMGECQIAVRALYDDELYPSRAVYRFRHDRKRHDDTAPRTMRRAPRRPGECYVLDVHHANVRVEHQGKVGTPKIMAVLDWATMRLKVHAIFFVESGSVRNADNIELMREVFTDPDQHGWGVPENIYVDNGKEYGFTRFLSQMMHLNAAGWGVSGRQATVIKALPYNGAAKRIENIFHDLNTLVHRHMQGFIGDDRMNPMEVAPGRLAAPMAGFEQYCELLAGAVHAFNWMPRASGHLKGKSPNGYMQECIDAGWRPTVLDPTDFDGIFVDRETRELVQHAIRLDNRIWTAPELDTCFEPRVVVCIPWLRAYNQVRVETVDGRFICIARPHEQVGWNDPRGAVSSARRRKDREAALRAREASAPDLDPLAGLVAYGQGRHSPTARPGGVMRVNLDGAAGDVAHPGDLPSVTNSERDVQAKARRALLDKMRSR